ncbi:MAG: hypothetical protein ABIJ16_10675, partial [Bacteroidota bacterium]
MKTYVTIYRKLFPVILLSALTMSLQAQNKLDKAREYKDNYQFANALALYTDFYKTRTPKKAGDIRDIAHCYLMMNDVQSAQGWLSRMTTFNVYSPDEMLDYASALKSLGKYDEAILQYRRFAKIFPKKSAAVSGWVEQCEVSKEWIENPRSFLIRNLENLNSDNSEFGLFPYGDGYLFSSDRTLPDQSYREKEIFGWTGNPYLKLYSLEKLDEKASATDIRPVSSVNSAFHNGPGVYDKNRDILIYTITRLEKDKSDIPTNSDPTSWEESGVDDRYVNRLEIYSVSRNGDDWGVPVAFPYNNIEKYSVGHPALSPDGNILYFVSDMPGGQGKSDIWYSERTENGEWRAPVNAGDKINSAGKEGFPVMTEDGILNFSSDGLPGMGGLDIFRATGNKDLWTAPENLKYPMNSPKDDFSLITDDGGLSGYFSSNRDGGKGEDDIYHFDRKLIIVGIAKSRLPDNSLLTLEDVILTIDNISDKKSETGRSDHNGRYLTIAKCGAEYELRASKSGYFTQTGSLEAVCSDADTLYVEMILDK